jgi:hypothetical protein
MLQHMCAAAVPEAHRETVQEHIVFMAAFGRHANPQR